MTGLVLFGFVWNVSEREQNKGYTNRELKQEKTSPLQCLVFFAVRKNIEGVLECEPHNLADPTKNIIYQRHNEKM